MTEPKQPEALELASVAESADLAGYPTAKKANAYCLCLLEDCAHMIRKLHAENESLRAERERNLHSIYVSNEIINKKNAELESLSTGYAAARLEIESLRARVYGAAFVSAYRAMRAAQPAGAQQPAPSAAVVFDAQGYRDWVYRNLPDETLVGNGAWWADHLTAWAKRFVKVAPQPSPTPHADSQPAPELTETAITAKNPAAPVSSFEDSRTQAVYEVLVNDNYPPAGSCEHWEGWKARLIVDALFPIEAPAAVAEPSDVETVDVVGVRANGAHVNLGKVAMPPRMKAREIAVEQFGGFENDDGSDAELCFWAMESFLDWLVAQGWTAAPTTQPAPRQEAQSALFDKQGFRAWVLHNIPDDTIIGSSAYWADHLSAWAQRFVKKAPQQEAQEPVAWYVTGCGRLLDEYEAEAEARRIGGTARAMPLYTVPQPSPASHGDALDALEATRKYGAESWDDWLTNKVDAAIEAARAALEGDK